MSQFFELKNLQLTKNEPSIMDIDPMDLIQPDDEPEPEENQALNQEKRKNQLNTVVAIAVALLATFIGVCKIKDDNIVQGMQQA